LDSAVPTVNLNLGKWYLGVLQGVKEQLPDGPEEQNCQLLVAQDDAFAASCMNRPHDHGEMMIFLHPARQPLQGREQSPHGEDRRTQLPDQGPGVFDGLVEEGCDLSACLLHVRVFCALQEPRVKLCAHQELLLFVMEEHRQPLSFPLLGQRQLHSRGTELGGSFLELPNGLGKLGRLLLDLQFQCIPRLLQLFVLHLQLDLVNLQLVQQAQGIGLGSRQISLHGVSLQSFFGAPT